MLVEAADQSFNRITVDGEMSTNDTVLLLANGKAGHSSLSRMDADAKAFQSILEKLCEGLAKSVIKDGEGATKFIEVRVKGAQNREDARKAAYAIAHSPLVKTAFFGEDANWGRILCALGYSGVPLNPDRVDVLFDNCPIVKNGMGVSAPLEARASQVIKKSSFKVTVDLHLGRTEFSVFTTDLSINYVKINGSYRS
jgi:glutamate N-acetyltransferase/amino-acid N-acetyltransferase